MDIHAFVINDCREKINVRKYWWPIKNGQSRDTDNIVYTIERKTKPKDNTIWVGHHYAQTNVNSVNEKLALLQTTGGKDEPNIVFAWWFGIIWKNPDGV